MRPVVVYSELYRCWPLVFECSCLSLGLDCPDPATAATVPFTSCHLLGFILTGLIKCYLQPVGGARLHLYSSLTPFLSLSLNVVCFTHFFYPLLNVLPITEFSAVWPESS